MSKMPAEKKKKKQRTEPASKPTPQPELTTQPLPTFSAFKLLQITLPALSHLPKTTTFTTHKPPPPTLIHPTHTLFIRPHDTRTSSTSSSQEYPSSRTLFIANIPVDSSVAHFRRLFRRSGHVERVIWHDRGVLLAEDERWRVHKCGGTAHVVFREEGSVERVLEMK
ncbi:hypothetical protein HK097_001899, partial [Rhizophlyctis rosea]